jgi:hypothetical protein
LRGENVKCPYCGKKGARIRPGGIRPGDLILTAIECHNPHCMAYNPIRYGYHPEMLPEKHERYRKYLKALHNE